MTSADLSPQQALQLRAAIARQLRYLTRLCARMHRLQFPVEDPLCATATRARDCLQDLHTMAHYAGCESRVGRPEK